METKAAGMVEKEERPTETKKLKIAWPPPSEQGSQGSILEEGIRVFKPKWPPEDEVLKPDHQEEVDQDLKKLRRTSSLKERSRPFTVAASFRTMSVKSHRTEHSSPAKAERSAVRLSDEPVKEAVVEEKKSVEESEAAGYGIAPDAAGESEEVDMGKQEIKGEESLNENGYQKSANTDEEEKENASGDSIPLNKEASFFVSPERTVSNSTIEREFSISPNHKFQDVGYFEGENLDMSVEEQIKRNRYYYDDEEEDGE